MVTSNSGFLPGPSTKILHGLYNKVSQFPELTSHTMRSRRCPRPASWWSCWKSAAHQPPLGPSTSEEPAP